jgi:Bacterial TniB protein
MDATGELLEAQTTADKERWRGQSRELRQAYMAADLHVHHPDLVRIAKETKRRMARCKNEKQGMGMLVLASSGVGKTHFCKFLKRRWPDEVTETVTRVPVTWFSIPQPLTTKSMYQSLLQSIADPLWNRGNVKELKERTEKVLPKIGVEVVLIDNAHDIPTNRRKAGVQEIGRWIRDFIDTMPTLVILLGIQFAREVIDVDPENQIRRRASAVYEMSFFGYKSPIEQQRFAKFLEMVDVQLPLAELCGLASPDFAQKLYWATFGVPHYIFSLIIEAVGVAADNHRERLILSDFERAFKSVFGDEGRGLNPFSENGPQRTLTEPGELFYSSPTGSATGLRRRSESGKNARASVKA